MVGVYPGRAYSIRRDASSGWRRSGGRGSAFRLGLQRLRCVIRAARLRPSLSTLGMNRAERFGRSRSRSPFERCEGTRDRMHPHARDASPSNCSDGSDRRLRASRRATPTRHFQRNPEDQGSNGPSTAIDFTSWRPRGPGGQVCDHGPHGVGSEPQAGSRLRRSQVRFGRYPRNERTGSPSRDLAETTGFEPVRDGEAPNRLAGGCFRPLSHVSEDDSTEGPTR